MSRLKEVIGYDEDRWIDVMYALDRASLDNISNKAIAILELAYAISPTILNDIDNVLASYFDSQNKINKESF